MKNLLAMFGLVLALMFVSCDRDTEKYTVETKTDGNGYTYETVKGDPMKVRIYTLKNGLKVYLKQNPEQPKIQTMIPVRVGSKNDPRETTGLAHYFEHIMFKGTDDLGTMDWEKEGALIAQISDMFEAHKNTEDPEKKKEIYEKIDSLSQEASKLAAANEYSKALTMMGGRGTNAWTSLEETVYVNEIPSNDLERWLKLESERFEDCVLRLFHTELETVFEEFNMGQDNDFRFAYYKLNSMLFPKHPYGVPVIGIGEHLKNPSMVNIMQFKADYYVPNNMAICLSGDLDFDKTIQLIDKYWGKMEANDNIPSFTPPVEEEIGEVKTADVFGPDQEFMMLAFRTKGNKDTTALYLDMIDAILNNSEAGLIDLNLNKSQKVLRAYTSHNAMNDYGSFTFSGYPREGQSLEEVRDLLLGELDKVKKGEFDEWLLDAIINERKLNKIRSAESNYSVYFFVDAFISNTPWIDKVKEMDMMDALTKDQLVAFANDFFKDNYVVVNKRTGENNDKMHVDKPSITPIDVNRDNESAFLKGLREMPVDQLQPVFLDFDKQVNLDEFSEGVKYAYTKNPNNDLAYVYYYADMGKYNDKMLPYALNYLEFIGTEKYSLSELSKEFYKLGINFYMGSGSDRSFVYIYGLDENLEKGLELLEHVIAEAKGDEESYNKYIEGILKDRQNAKLNKGAILWNGLYNYAKYGKDNPFTNRFTEEEMKAFKAEDLTNVIKDFFSYKHNVFYYGPREKEAAKKMIAQYHKPAAELKDIKPLIDFPELDIDQKKVLFCNYDMVQTQIVLLAKRETFDTEMYPMISLFNQYYGGSMSSIVFQEMREAKGLAYSSFASYSTPWKKDLSNYVFAYIATQPDKLTTALTTFDTLLNQMVVSEKAFNDSKEAILQKLNSERIIKDQIFWTYLSNQKKGFEGDYRKDVYENVSNYTIQDLEKFFNEHVKGNTYQLLIIGDKSKIDFESLKSYGAVEEYTIEELFGY